jgi:hypothetical protein
MDIAEIVTAIATTMIAIIALIVSISSVRMSKKTMHYQILHEVQNDYRSIDIMVSIAALQEKYKECFCKNKNLKKEFIKQYEKERKDKKLSIEKTLNYHRRNLTYFYSNLAFLYAYKIFSREMIL